MNVPASASLFQRDLFSEQTPVYTACSEQLSLKITRILSQAYAHLGSFTAPAEQVGAQELNSKNFRITTTSGLYAVKRTAFSPAIEPRLQLVHDLDGVRVPEIVTTSTDGLMFRSEDEAWILTKFISGSYFAGSPAQLASFARHIRQLVEQLRNSCQAEIPSVPLPGQEDLAFLKSLNSCRQHWASILGNEISGQLSEHWQRLHQALEAGLDLTNHDHSPQSQEIVHYDLHPHNLIYQEQELACILDFDGFIRSDPGVMYGFGLLKVLRQAWVWARENAQPAGPELLLSLSPLLQELGLGPAELASRATVEVLRRILAILRRAFEQQDTSWLHVLPIQLRALEEVELVFAPYEV